MRKPLVYLAVAGLALTGCGDGQHKPRAIPSKPSAAASTTPPPSFTAAHVQAALLAQGDIGSGMRQSTVAVESLRDNKAPMCSLSGAEVPGHAQITTRQFINPDDHHLEPKYAQLVARYDDPQTAASAYAGLKGKASSCPKKQHVPQKRLQGTFYLFEHDDTWTVSEDTVAGWAHLRGTEKHVEPPGDTRRNVYHFFYDYAVRGNVLVATLYWERTEPSDSADAIVKRATAVLTKQLQKIG